MYYVSAILPGTYLFPYGLLLHRRNTILELYWTNSIIDDSLIVIAVARGGTRGPGPPPQLKCFQW